MKVLFCYITPASGHQRAAEAVMNAIRDLDPQVECEGIHSVTYARPALGKLVSRLYINVLKHAPQIWDFLYDNPTIEKATRDVRDLLNVVSTRRILKLLRESRPNAIVCTQAVPAGLLSALKERGKIRLPLFGIITDFGVHNYWLSRHVDLYMVPTEDVRRKMIRAGIPENRIRLTGIPVDPHFALRGDKRTERLHLGLSPARPTVLVMGGSYGLGPLESVVSSLRRLPLGLQVIVVCGNNRKLLLAMNKRFGADRMVRVLGHTKAVHRLMDAADILISKPGGLTSAESLAKGLPLIMINPIPGQEERNAEFLARHGAALRAETPEEVVAQAHQLLAHRARLDRLREKADVLARPRAAHDAAETILQHLNAPAKFQAASGRFALPH